MADLFKIGPRPARRVRIVPDCVAWDNVPVGGEEPTTVQTYRERRPAPLAARHVTCVWVQQVAQESAPYTHRTVPNGSAEVLCAIGEVPRVVGPQNGPTEEVLPPGSVVVGVRFRPGAAPSGLGLPASELVDLDLGADELWGGSAVALGEALAACASPQEAAARLEAAIVGRLADGTDLDPIAIEAVSRLLPGRTHDVGSLTSELFISERQLRRRCQAAIGLAPKTLHRMLRFQGFLALAGTRERPSTQLARLAAEAGYADQSHLTRESVRLTGISPHALMLESEQHCGCAHDHAASYGPLLQPH
jgi:AraC-like DNA-binding protein